MSIYNLLKMWLMQLNLRTQHNDYNFIYRAKSGVVVVETQYIFQAPRCSRYFGRHFFKKYYFIFINLLKQNLMYSRTQQWCFNTKGGRFFLCTLHEWRFQTQHQQNKCLITEFSESGQIEWFIILCTHQSVGWSWCRNNFHFYCDAVIRDLSENLTLLGRNYFV